MQPDTLLIDFGGVLTTSVLDSFAEFCRSEELEHDAVLRCVSKDEVGRRLLVEIEEGRISGEDFQVRFAARLSELGDRVVEPDGLLSRLNAALRPEPALVAATESLRRAGVCRRALSVLSRRRTSARAPRRPAGVPPGAAPAAPAAP